MHLVFLCNYSYLKWSYFGYWAILLNFLGVLTLKPWVGDYLFGYHRSSRGSFLGQNLYIFKILSHFIFWSFTICYFVNFGNIEDMGVNSLPCDTPFTIFPKTQIISMYINSLFACRLFISFSWILLSLSS